MKIAVAIITLFVKERKSKQYSIQTLLLLPVNKILVTRGRVIFKLNHLNRKDFKATSLN